MLGAGEDLSVLVSLKKYHSNWSVAYSAYNRKVEGSNLVPDKHYYMVKVSKPDFPVTLSDSKMSSIVLLDSDFKN